MYLTRWQDNMLPTILLQGHNWVSTITATGAFEEFQEEKPPMTRKELLSSNHRQSLIEDFRQARMTGTPICCSRVALREKREGGPRRYYSSKESMLCFLMWCPTPAFITEQASDKLRRIDDTKRSMSNRTAEYEERVQLHTALQPAVYCKLALAWPELRATSEQRRSSERSASCMAARRQTTEAHQRRQERHEQSHCQGTKRRCSCTLHSNLQCTANGACESQEMQANSEYRWNSKQRTLAWRQGPPDTYRRFVVAERDLCCNIVW